MLESIKLNKSETIIFSVGFIGSLIARGMLLFSLGYAIDDYNFMHVLTDWSFGFNQGRWGAGIFNQLLTSIGVQSVYANTLLVFTSFLFMAYVGVLICRIWNISDKILLSSLVVLIFITHPYQAEIYTFKIANAGFAYPVLFAFLSLYLSEYNKKSILLTGSLFAFSLSMYQIILSYILVVFLFSIVFFYLKNNNSNNIFISLKKIFFNSVNRAHFLTISFGIVIYTILNKVILIFFNEEIVARGKFLRIGDAGVLSKRLLEIKDALVLIYLKGELIMPLTLKIILLALLMFSIYGVFRYLYDSKNTTISLLNIGIFLSMLMLLCVSFFILLFVLKDWWLAPRVLAAVSLFWGGIVILFYSYCDFKYKNNGLIVFGSLLIFGFIAINNHIYLDQIRINKLDENKANRIISKIESEEGFFNVRSLAIIGNSWTYPMRLSTVMGDMNISAFGAQWSKIPMINEISGYNFSEPSAETFLFASEYCKNSPKWPLDNSVNIINDLGIVCL